MKKTMDSPKRCRIKDNHSSPSVTEEPEQVLRGDLKCSCYKKKTTFASLREPMSLLELDLPYNEMAAA